MRISTVRHPGFIAVALAGAAAATGWILSRFDVVDASEEQSSSYREAYAQSDADAKAIENRKGLRLNYYDAHWSRVLEDLAKHTQLTLVMDKVPPGRFARRDRTRYTADGCIRILNRELEVLGFRLLRQGQFLIVLHLDQARTRYARPVLSAAHSTESAVSARRTRPVHTAGAQVDQLGAQWTSMTDEGDDTPSHGPTSRTTTPIRRGGFQNTADTATSTNESSPGEVRGTTAVIRQLEIRHGTAAEVARAVYLVFKRRAELIQLVVKRQDGGARVKRGRDQRNVTGYRHPGDR